MKIRVELQAYLEDYSPGDGGIFAYEMPDGATVADLIRRLGVPEELASVLVIGEEAVEPAQTLHEGDRVTVIPPVAGGSRSSARTTRLNG
jgi:molybdopterin converting factor small subunit